jgi:hypothetical protein
MKCKKLTIFLLAIIALLLGALIYSNLPKSGIIEYGLQKTAHDLPKKIFVDTYLKRNVIVSGGVMEIIARIPNVKMVHEKEEKGSVRVLVRYAYPDKILKNPTSYAYDFYADGTTRVNFPNDALSMKYLVDDYYKIEFNAPSIPGPYNVTVSDPMQEYQITVVDSMADRDRLLAMLRQYIYTQYNLINQIPLDVTIKELIVGEKYLEVTHSTSYKVCRTKQNSVAEECTLRYLAGKIFVEPDTGIVRRDDSVFIDKPNEVWERDPTGGMAPLIPK